MTPFDDIDLDELFESSGEATMVKKLVAVVRTGASPTALELASDEARVLVIPDDDSGQLKLEATIHNRLGIPVELDELYVLVRDADGTLLDYADYWINTTFSRAQEVVHGFLFPAGVLEEVASLDLWADYEYGFRKVVAMAQVELTELQDGVSPRVPLGLTVTTNGDQGLGPIFDLKMSAFCALVWEPEVTVLLEVSEAGVSDGVSDGLARELVVALRDADGEMIAREEASVARAGGGTPSLAKLTFPLQPGDLARLSRIDVAISGTVDRHESLGRFELLESH